MIEMAELHITQHNGDRNVKRHRLLFRKDMSNARYSKRSGR
jgi:hypothetical protein